MAIAPFVRTGYVPSTATPQAWPNRHRGRELGGVRGTEPRSGPKVPQLTSGAVWCRFDTA
eukprot:2699764-Alexandrium_andersonii.AAC.1